MRGHAARSTVDGIGRTNPERRRRPGRFVTTIAATLAMLGACTGNAGDKAGGRERVEPVVVTLVRPDNSFPLSIGRFAEEVERLSEGTIRIEYVDDVWHDGDPAQEVRLIEDVQAGNVDIGWVGARVFDSFGVTSFQALLAPLLVDSYELQDRVFEAGIPMRMLDGIEQVGVTGIGVLPGPLRKIMGLAHPFITPADYAGMVVGNSGGELTDETFRTLGATPQRVPSSTSLEGLDGLDYPVSAIYGNRYYETARFVTANVNWWPRPLVIVMNTERFADLAAEHRQILRTAASNTVTIASEMEVAGESESRSGICGTGIAIIEASDAEQATLARAVEPIYTRLEADAETKAFLDQIRALKEQVASPSDSFECPSEEVDAEQAAATAIDGAYQVTTTLEELRAAGDPVASPDNVGELTMVLDRGRFASTIQNGEICTWTSGTYVVDGDQVEFSVLDGSAAPNGSANRLGEVFDYGWSRYRDTLTLTAVPGEISPEPLRVKPWRRTDENPSLSVFPERCPPPDEALPGATPDTVVALDGVYRVTTTRADEVASGEPVIYLENYGEWVLVFDRGRFAFGQQNGEACTWAYGTYVVDGDRVEWSFVDGGGIAPTDAVNKPGEFYVFRGSRYRDTLTLTAVPGEISPPPFMHRPWRRTDETPSLRVFSERCPPPPEALG
jgi:TRAP-type C4-dicarboxylate transport system substrate-binding protein